MPNTLTTLTERGQVSMPAGLRRQLGLKPGQPLIWEKVSDNECRVTIVRKNKPDGVRSMRGFMKRFHKDLPKTTSAWMRMLREGDFP